MNVSDLIPVIVYMIEYCVPAAFIVNLVGFGCRTIIRAATGRIFNDSKW